MKVFSVDQIREISSRFMEVELIHYARIETLDTIHKTSLLRSARESKENIHAACKLIEQYKNMANSSRLLESKEEKSKKLRDEFIVELYKFNQAALSFSLRSIRSAKLREDYTRNILRSSEDLRMRFDTALEEGRGADSLRELTDLAIDSRNFILEQTREKLNPAARQFSKIIKNKGAQFDRLRSVYETKLQNRVAGFEALDVTVQEQMIYAEIIDASGRSSQLFNRLAKIGGGLGILLFVGMFISLGVSICEADSAGEVIAPIASTILSVAASFGGEIAGEAAGIAIGEALTTSAGAVAGIALTCSVAGAFILGFLAGGLFDTILNALSSPHINVFSLQYGGGPYGTKNPDAEIPDYGLIISDVLQKSQKSINLNSVSSGLFRNSLPSHEEGYPCIKAKL